MSGRAMAARAAAAERAGPLAWLATGIRLPFSVAGLALVLYTLLLAGPYEVRVLTVAGIYALLVIGYQFIFGHAGALSLAQGTFFGVGAYVTGILGANFGWTFLATMPLSILAAALLAVVVAVPVLRLESHYFALATLGIGLVALLTANNWIGLTGGANGMPGVPGVVVFGERVPRGLPLAAVVWAFVAAGGLLAWQITRGLYGRAYEVMRENPLAAGALGINTSALRLVALVLSAAYAGAAGALQVHTLRIVSPDVLEFHVMVACLTMAVVGGRYRVAGAIVGAIVLVHLPEWFRFLEKYYLLAYGAGMLAMIVAAPYGIVGAIAALRARLAPEAPRPRPKARPLPPAPARATGDVVLATRALSRAFGGVVAANRVDLALGRGEILGLIGPNGSGKTTLVNLVTGNYKPDSGRILLHGADIAGLPPHEISRRGIARTFQNLNLVADMTVLDNVAVARAGADRVGLRDALAECPRAGRLAVARGYAVTLLEALGIAEHAMTRCGDLPHGIQRRVEIARALATQPELLLLDEPAAGLNETEQQDLADRLRRLRSEGLTLLVVEHNMPFLMPLADRMVCLDYGEVIAEGTPAEIRRHPKVVLAYLGGEPEETG